MLTNYNQSYGRIETKHEIDFFNLEEKYFTQKKENEKFFFPWAIENTESYRDKTVEEIQNLEDEETELKRKLELVHKKISALKKSQIDI